MSVMQRRVQRLSPVLRKLWQNNGDNLIKSPSNDVINRKDDEIDWYINSACINFSSLVLHPACFAENK
jgi:hypothetical protein